MAFDVLIIDDESDIRELISGILEDEGYETRQAHDADSGLEQISKRLPNLVFLDIWMQGSRLDGLQLLDELQEKHPNMPVVMISGHGNLETAVAAIKRGAYDYIEKPFKIDRLLLVTKRAIETSKLKIENKELKERTSSWGNELVGISPIINEARLIIEKSAPTNSRIFISGPPGVGKGHCARLLHKKSLRRDAAFIEINASLYDPEELPAILFGREEKGKDGKINIEVGALERAHAGTIYLSEVTMLSLNVQSLLLRMLVNNSFVRVGGSRPVPVDVRILSSSSQDVNELCESGKFRSDLLHRLSVVPLKLTPLKERREDIPPLVDCFVEQICKLHSIPKFTIAEDAKAVLQAQDWPANARQLRNSIERLAILVADKVVENGEVNAEMLPSDIGEVLPNVNDDGGTSSAHLMGMSLRDAREVFERQYLLAQIERFGGNISKTAEFIGMERSALHRKIKSLGL